MKRTLLIFVSCLGLLLPVVSKATTVERLTMDGLVKKADRIVVGRVNGARTYWTADRKLIVTTYSLTVQETLKGERTSNVDVTTIGGTIGDRTLHVAGMPTFAKGEDAVVFVEKAGAFSTVLGLGQGKFVVENGEVSNNVSDLRFPDGRPGQRVRMQLKELKQQIQEILEP
jgi:hypothetical protein